MICQEFLIGNFLSVGIQTHTGIMITVKFPPSFIHLCGLVFRVGTSLLLLCRYEFESPWRKGIFSKILDKDKYMVIVLISSVLLLLKTCSIIIKAGRSIDGTNTSPATYIYYQCIVCWSYLHLNPCLYCLYCSCVRNSKLTVVQTRRGATPQISWRPRGRLWIYNPKPSDVIQAVTYKIETVQCQQDSKS